MDRLKPGGSARPPEASILAVAEIDPSGVVRSVNKWAREAWGWTDGSRLPNALRIGLSELDPGETSILPIAAGGPDVLAARFDPASGWMLVGAGSAAGPMPVDASGFKSLIEKMPVCVTVFRKDGTVLFANAETTSLTGFDASDVVQRRLWMDAVHPEDRWKLIGAQRRALECGRATVSLRVRTRARGTRLFEFNLFCARELGPVLESVTFDVTERNEVEEALFQSEALYRVFLEQSPVGMLHVDAGGTITFENHQLRQIIGEGVEDAWIGRSFDEIDSLDSRVRKLVRSMLADGAAFHGEMASFRRPGMPIQSLLLHGSPIQHPEGGIVGGVVMVEDRTDERQRREELELRNRYANAEADLRKAALGDIGQQAFLSTAARLLGEAAGADRVHLLINNATGDGCASRARWWRNLVDEPDALYVLHLEDSVLNDAVAGRQALHIHRPDIDGPAVSLIDRTGAREAIWHPFFDEARLGGFVVLERVGVSNDGAPVTWRDPERGLLEQLVRLFETLWSWMLAGSRYRKITATIEDGLFSYTFDEDGDRRYLFVTPQVERLTGRAADELVGDGAISWSEAVVHEADHALVDRHDESLRRGAESRVSYRVRHSDGSIRWLQEQANPETDGMGDILVSGILTDVTEQKAAEEVLTDAKQQAESANRLKSAFIATMSHEIRTPMGAVNGFAELLTRELADLEDEGITLPPQVIEFLQAIRDNSKRLLTLVNDLFDLSNLEVGSIELRRGPVPLNEIVMRATSKVAVRLSRKGVDLQVDLAEGDPVVLGDAQRLEQVVDNLLSNAVKFTDEGVVRVRTRIDGPRAILEVEDTGVGIADSHLERLFEPFSQEDSRLNRQYEGSGLGLSLAKRLLELMNGTIDVESQKGEGSIFRVRLPRRDADVHRGPIRLRT